MAHDSMIAAPSSTIVKLVNRILSKCVLGVTSWRGTQCWVWQRCVCNKGYAEIKVDGVARRAHRVLWEIVTERKIREGYTLDHRCLNTSCIRPEHLEEVTRRINTARGNKTRHKPKESIRW
jgi:hypothetical protein